MNSFETDRLTQFLLKDWSPEEIVETNELSTQAATRPCSTGQPDCLYLASLVRFFQPKHILEIGTFIGTTAQILGSQCRRNGQGHVVTVDMDQSNCTLPEWCTGLIETVEAKSSEALARFRDESRRFDFVFIDANITAEDMRVLDELTTDDAVLVTHDFTFSDGEAPILDKGLEVVALKSMESNKSAYYFLQRPKRLTERWEPVVCGSTGSNSCCATMLSDAAFQRLVAEGFESRRTPGSFYEHSPVVDKEGTFKTRDVVITYGIDAHERFSLVRVIKRPPTTLPPMHIAQRLRSAIGRLIRVIR